MIRAPHPADVDAIARVHVATWRHAYQGLIDPDFLDSLDVEERARRWLLILEQGRSTVLVADRGDEVVGFCSVGPSDREALGELYAIYVLPSHWDTGTGAALLAAGETALGERGFDRAVLWVLEGNARARRFYERHGWHLGKPIRVEHFGSGQVTEVRYEKDLRG